jgi:mannosyl-oligosaccharide alpha-1,2-mannosidase
VDEVNQKVTHKKKVVTKSKKKTVKKKEETAAPFDPEDETTVAETDAPTQETEGEQEESNKSKFVLQTGIKADVEKMDAVRTELKFSWDKYKEYAWGHDILAPLGKRGKRWVGSGIQIIDALDTLFIAGLKKEYEDGIEWIEKDLKMSTYRADLPVFESCIRILGGLLGAYALDPRPVLLDRAKGKKKYFF